MHSLTVVGRLGGDPELRYTPDGKPVTTFSVADNAARGATVWFRVTAWERLAEVCNQYLAKGRHVAIVGHLRADDAGGPRVWTGRDGQARASFDVTAQSVEFMGGGRGDAPQQEPEPVRSEPPQQEIPF